jgi:hypothetical protein
MRRASVEDWRGPVDQQVILRIPAHGLIKVFHLTQYSLLFNTRRRIRIRI